MISRPKRTSLRRPSTQAAVHVIEATPEQALVPYDENLLERARTQWQFGDWQSLAQIDLDTMQYHPDRAKLALLAAAGRLQTGGTESARPFIQLASDWGCSEKLISQILVAGVHNSLGRAATIIGQQLRALRHFESAIATGGTLGDRRLLVQARIQEQHAQLGLPPVAPGSISPTPTYIVRHSFVVTTLAKHPLGDAWAANTVNTVIFRHHGILTHGKIQYTAFYVDPQALRLVRRNLETDTIETYDILGEYNLRDAHNCISLGMDRQGHLHLSYDHHGTRLRYRRGLKPGQINCWTDELPMTGQHEEKVTYPTFILPRQGLPLSLLYRDGKYDRGTARLKTYDEEQQIWADHPHAILSGSDQKPWTSNAYWNHPAIGTDSSLHLSFVWRTHALGDEQRINNINIGYACSQDNGLNWMTSKGRAYRLPITPTNAETVHPVSPGSNLINQCSMALDSRNRPHIVFYADDPDGVPQYQHLRYDGRRWIHQIISQRTQPFALEGGGTLQIPISRPEIILDRSDNAYIIARGDFSGNRLTATRLSAPDYAWSAENTQVLWEEDLGFAEPVIDRMRWQQENILSLLVQHNEQPNYDVGHTELMQPVTLVDLKFQ